MNRDKRMNEKEKEAIYRRAINKWGHRAQYEMAQEEATELALAIRKFIRSKDDSNYQDLIEEIADVEIMIEQILYMNSAPFMRKLIDETKEKKLIRLSNRLDQNSFE